MDDPRFPGTGPAEPPAWAAGPLEWTQPDWRDRAWDLSCDGRVIGSMRARGMLPERWEAEGPSGRWRFRSRWTGRTGIFRGESETPVATYEPGWPGRGTITTARGESFAWRLAGFLPRSWVVNNDSGFAVLRIAGRPGFLHFGGRIEIDEAGRRLHSLEALVLLGWRIALQKHRRSRAGGGGSG